MSFARTGTNPPSAPRLRLDVRIVTDLQTAKAKSLMAFFEHTRLTDGPLPRYAIPNSELAPMMASLFLVEATDAHGNDWRYRLTSRAFFNTFSAELRDRTISEVYDVDQAAEVAKFYRKVAFRAQVLTARGLLGKLGRDGMEIEMPHVPIEGAAGQPNRVLGGIFPLAQ